MKPNVKFCFCFINGGHENFDLKTECFLCEEFNENWSYTFTFDNKINSRIEDRYDCRVKDFFNALSRKHISTSTKPVYLYFEGYEN
jgi:hypothetical protein